jgi:hypothetical protein
MQGRLMAWATAVALVLAALAPLGSWFDGH